MPVHAAVAKSLKLAPLGKALVDLGARLLALLERAVAHHHRRAPLDDQALDALLVFGHVAQDEVEDLRERWEVAAAVPVDDLVERSLDRNRVLLVAERLNRTAQRRLGGRHELQLDLHERLPRNVIVRRLLLRRALIFRRQNASGSPDRRCARAWLCGWRCILEEARVEPATRVPVVDVLQIAHDLRHVLQQRLDGLSADRRSADVVEHDRGASLGRVVPAEPARLDLAPQPLLDPVELALEGLEPLGRRRVLLACPARPLRHFPLLPLDVLRVLQLLEVDRAVVHRPGRGIAGGQLADHLDDVGQVEAGLLQADAVL
mmetsp:Transcript_36408/g.117318  ORF Transcript_36408/g.117318 Transcript_36408/m.117318 type:complete len:318 (+) Transcript_36408:6046-6999(+)